MVNYPRGIFSSIEHKGKTFYDYQAIQFYQTQKNYFLDIIDFYDLQDIASES